MKALCRHGTGDVRIDTVPDPKIIESRDGDNQSHRHPYFCRSDLHVYGGEMPTMESGDVLGHEFMGEVMEVGSGAAGPLKPGDRVVVPFTISCGSCFFCQRRLFSLCDTSNPNAEMARNVMDIPPQACSVIPICWTRSFCRDRFDMEY